MYMEAMRLHVEQALMARGHWDFEFDAEDETMLEAVLIDTQHLQQGKDVVSTVYNVDLIRSLLDQARHKMRHYYNDLPETDTCWVTGVKGDNHSVVWVGGACVVLAPAVAAPLLEDENLRMLPLLEMRPAVARSAYGAARLRPALRRLALQQQEEEGGLVRVEKDGCPPGEGSFGRVYPARVQFPSPAWGEDDQCVLRRKQWVIKVCKGEEDAEVLMREIIGLLALSHPHVAHGLGVGRLKGTTCLVLEDAGMDLSAFLDLAGREMSSPTHVAACNPHAGTLQAAWCSLACKDTALSLADHLLAQILAALAYLHDNMGMVHGDLKPQNVCVRPERAFLVRLVDLGSLELISDNAKLCTTAWYRSPEQELAQAHRAPADVWSAGCVYAQLLAVLEGKGGLYRSTVLCPAHTSQFECKPGKHQDTQLRANLRGALHVHAAMHMNEEDPAAAAVRDLRAQLRDMDTAPAPGALHQFSLIYDYQPVPPGLLGTLLDAEYDKYVGGEWPSMLLLGAVPQARRRRLASMLRLPPGLRPSASTLLEGCAAAPRAGAGVGAPARGGRHGVPPGPQGPVW